MKYLILLVTMLLVILSSCQTNQQDTKRKAAYLAVNKIFEGGNVDELDAYITEDAIDHQMDPSITNKTGLAGIKETFQYYHKIFSDMKSTVHSMAVSGDTLFAYFTSTATNKEPYMGMPAGQQQTMNGVDVVVFEGDKMKEHWGFMDMSDVMKMTQSSMPDESMMREKQK